MLDWDDLRFFAVLGEEGSLAATGRRLGVDHVTVARRVANLEESTGLKLVDRRDRRTTLTSAGLRVANHARRMQDEAFSLERTLMMSKSDLAAEVSVSLPPLLAMEWIAPRLKDLFESHPEMSIRLTGEARTVSLSRREADIAMRLSRPIGDALIARKIGVLRYRLFATPEYLAANERTRYRYILFDPSLRNLPQQAWMHSVIGDDPPVALRSNEMAIQCAAAIAGAGIAVLPEFIATKHGLLDSDPSSRYFERDIWLTWHEDLRGQPAIVAVAEFLAACVPRSGS